MKFIISHTHTYIYTYVQKFELKSEDNDERK